MILDSHLILYAALPEYPGLRRLIADHSPAVSAISVVEVLGYHKLSAADKTDFEVFFARAKVLPLSGAVIQRAASLRQSRKMSLGDALVAATALVYVRELLTRNVKDLIGVPRRIAKSGRAKGKGQRAKGDRHEGEPARGEPPRSAVAFSRAFILPFVLCPLHSSVSDFAILL